MAHAQTPVYVAHDRAQMEDNFHLGARFAEQPSRSTTGPGLFYRLRYGHDLQLVCIDTSVDSDGTRRSATSKHPTSSAG